MGGWGKIAANKQCDTEQQTQKGKMAETARNGKQQQVVPPNKNAAAILIPPAHRL